jgi:DNA-binding NtrC family response regulator
VRELRNVIERAAVLATGDAILPADLPGHVTGVTAGPMRGLVAGASPSVPSRSAAAGAVASAAGGRTLAPEDAAERQRIIDALEQCAGNQTRAAKLLGMPLRTLVNRLAAYDVARPRKRS